MSEEALVARRSGRLDVVLADLLPELSRSRLASLVRDGCVHVEGRQVTRPSEKIREGQAIHVRIPDPAPAAAQPEDLPLSIVYADADIAVIDKAPGMVVHPGAGHPNGTLVNALLFHLDGLSGIGGVQRPGIVHRLDRGTSGLMVVAKHDQAHHALAAQFADKSAGRRYIAMVHGKISDSSGTITSQLARHPSARTRFASTTVPGQGKRAVTHWRRLSLGQSSSLVECRLETGRTHQIRVHLAELRHPLINDGDYGRRPPPSSLIQWCATRSGRPILHAWRLQLTHPSTGERMTWMAPLPADVKQALSLEGHDPEALPQGAC